MTCQVERAHSRKLLNWMAPFLPNDSCTIIRWCCTCHCFYVTDDKCATNKRVCLLSSPPRHAPGHQAHCRGEERYVGTDRLNGEVSCPSFSRRNIKPIERSPLVAHRKWLLQGRYREEHCCTDTLLWLSAFWSLRPKVEMIELKSTAWTHYEQYTLNPLALKWALAADCCVCVCVSVYK